MKQMCTRIAICLLLSFLLTGLNTNTASACSAPDFDSVDEQIQGYAEQYHIPGMAVIVVNKEGALFMGTYGNCKRTDTPFIIGSMSKSFTALSIMQLAETGRLRLDDAISNYIDPSLYLKNPSDGERITVRQLLNHTSGLGTYQRFGNACITDSYGSYRYANVNYGLLGKIIEAVSGERYSDYVEEHIFSPLDMTHASATRKDAEADGLIDGYRNYFGFPVKGAPDYPDDGSWSTVPAGYITASISDMGAYLRMYLNGGEGVIEQRSMDLMFYSSVPQDNTGHHFYGMGWGYADDFLNEPVLSHSGLVENYTSNMFLLPERGIGVAVLVNMNDYLVSNNLLGNVVMVLLGGEAQALPEASYIKYHALIDAVYLLILVTAALPLLRLRRWKQKKRSGKGFLLDLFLHAVLPGLLLLLPRIAGVPLWVIWYFVKDLWLTLAVSAALLFGTGLFKCVHQRKSRRAF